MEVGSVRRQARVNDKEFQQIEDYVLRRKEDQLEEELKKFREDKRYYRQRVQDNYKVISDLLDIHARKKEIELQGRLDKEQIQRGIHEINKKASPSATDASRRAELERLAKERDYVFLKEKEWFSEVDGMENELNKLRKLEREATGESRIELATNKKLNEMIEAERSDRVRGLLNRWEDIVRTKNNINDTAARIINGGAEALNGMVSILPKPSSSSFRNAAQDIVSNSKGFQTKQPFERAETPKKPINEQPLGIKRNEMGTNTFPNERIRPMFQPAPPLPPPVQLGQLPPQPPGYQNAQSLLQALNENELLKNQLQKETELLAKRRKTGNLNGFTLGSNKQSGEIRQGNFSLSDMRLNMKGYKGADLYENMAGQELHMNEIQNVQLDDWEGILQNYFHNDVDTLALLSKVPVGSDLYKFLSDEFSHTSAVRMEGEKIVLETYMQDLRRQFDLEKRREDQRYQNAKWTNDTRKMIVSNRINKDILGVQPKKHPKSYDPREGFVVHWDYVLGLPKRSDYSTLTFLVAENGEFYEDPLQLQPASTEVETSETMLSIFGVDNNVRDIPPNPEMFLIWEVQLPASQDDGANARGVGWTFIDLFDFQKRLKRGRFKAPLYQLPTNLKLRRNTANGLPIIQGMWFHFRISYPWTDEYSKIASLSPETTRNMYIVPDIHLRNAQVRPGAISMVAPPPARLPSRESIESEKKPKKKPKKQVVIEEESEESEPPPKEDTPPPEKEQKEPEEEPVEETKVDEPPSFNESLLQKRGINVGVRNLRNYQTPNRVKVAVLVLEDGKPILDENRQTCAKNTSIHDPYSKNRPDLQGLASVNGTLESDLLAAANNKSLISNKMIGTDLLFNEDFRFLQNFPYMYSVHQKPQFLMFQVLEAVQSKKGNKSVNKSSSMSDWKPVAWFVHELIEPTDLSIREGVFAVPLFDKPVRRPPVDPESIQTIEAELEFTVNTYIYDKTDLDQQKSIIRVHKEPKPPKAPKKREKREDKKNNESTIDNSPFIKNLKPCYTDRPFEKGHGIDFYIDGCRFLPDMVTVTKIVLTVFTKNYEEPFERTSAVPLLEPGYNTFTNVFNNRREFRNQRFDPTCMAYLTLITKDKYEDELRIIGYCAINLFINRYSKKQPENDHDTDIVLYDGNYQLPIICQEPLRVKPFCMEKLQKLERLPTASVLVRIRRAPLSNDNLRVLGIKDIDQKDWAKTGVWEPMPPYNRGSYNTELCEIRDSENELFQHRANRSDPPMKETAMLLVNQAGISREMSEPELAAWIDKNIESNSGTKIINLEHFAHYQTNAGFKFVIDAVHRVPTNAAFICIYSINPPGKYYGTENPSTEDLQLISNIDWEGPVGSVRYNEQYFNFRDIVYDSYKHIVVEVKQVKMTDIKITLEDYGWTIVPIFKTNNFVLSGYYQFPVFKGRPPLNVLSELCASDPWEVIKAKLNEKKSGVTLIKPVSILCRLMDSQREVVS